LIPLDTTFNASMSKPMYGGKVVKSGGPELAKRLEEEGYEWVKEEFGAKSHIFNR
jgi:Fe-S cluster assembly ATPase SufC